MKKEIYFWNNVFIVNQDVLDPRPETELLLEFSLHILNSILKPELLKLPSTLPTFHSYPSITLSEDIKFPIRILDCGTGSGCIGISLASILEQHFTNLNLDSQFNEYIEIILSDISDKSIEIARTNRDKILKSPDTVKILNSNLLEYFIMNQHEQYPSIIIANLPYIAPNYLPYVDVPNDPRLALEGKIQHKDTLHFEPSTLSYSLDGLDLIQGLFAQCQNIPHQHVILLEVDPLQFDTLARIASSFSYTHIGSIRDYSNYNRIFYCEKNPT